jgi:HD-GYP domain-containing protein (c-di-GMP phosphodiesterase class II)
MAKIFKYRTTYLAVAFAMVSVNLLSYLQSILMNFERPLSGYIVPSLVGVAIGILFSVNRVRLLDRAGEQRKLLLNIVQALSVALDERDAYTYGHSERVTNYSLELGRRVGLTRDELEILEIGSILHDIGKIGVSDTILNKPGQLSDEEMETIMLHPVKGERILGQSRDLKNSKFVDCIRSHHERYDGKGYPDGLIGEKIPLMARIIAISDTFDAMTSLRPYRQKKSIKEALNELQRCAGRQLDPKLVTIFCEMMDNEQFDLETSGYSFKPLNLAAG